MLCANCRSVAFLYLLDFSIDLELTFLSNRERKTHVRSATFCIMQNARDALHSKVSQMFRRSQTRSDNTNVDGKRRETRDYSPWTSLQMGKIWSQVHDACKNVAKLAATSVGRVARDASKLERSQRNLFQVTDASLVENSCAEICEEIRDKNLTRSKNERESEVRREREIGDRNEYRDDAKASMRQNPRAVVSSRFEMREQVHENAKKEKNEKSCVFYRGMINSDQSAHIYLLH